MYAIMLLMAKTNTRKPAKITPKQVSKQRSAETEPSYESDGTYFLKLVVFVLLGTLWLKFLHPVSWQGIPLNGLPLGLLFGLVLVSYFEKHQSDRKIWYAILLVVTIICYFVPAGIVI